MINQLKAAEIKAFQFPLCTLSYCLQFDANSICIFACNGWGRNVACSIVSNKNVLLCTHSFTYIVCSINRFNVCLHSNLCGCAFSTGHSILISVHMNTLSIWVNMTLGSSLMGVKSSTKIHECNHTLYWHDILFCTHEKHCTRLHWVDMCVLLLVSDWRL